MGLGHRKHRDVEYALMMAAGLSALWAEGWMHKGKGICWPGGARFIWGCRCGRPPLAAA